LTNQVYDVYRNISGYDGIKGCCEIIIDKGGIKKNKYCIVQIN